MEKGGDKVKGSGPNQRTDQVLFVFTGSGLVAESVRPASEIIEVKPAPANASSPLITNGTSALGDTSSWTNRWDDESRQRSQREAKALYRKELEKQIADRNSARSLKGQEFASEIAKERRQMESGDYVHNNPTYIEKGPSSEVRSRSPSPSGYEDYNADFYDNETQDQRPRILGDGKDKSETLVNSTRSARSGRHQRSKDSSMDRDSLHSLYLKDLEEQILCKKRESEERRRREEEEEERIERKIKQDLEKMRDEYLESITKERPLKCTIDLDREKLIEQGLPPQDLEKDRETSEPPKEVNFVRKLDPVNSYTILVHNPNPIKDLAPTPSSVQPKCDPPKAINQNQHNQFGVNEVKLRSNEVSRPKSRKKTCSRISKPVKKTFLKKKSTSPRNFQIKVDAKPRKPELIDVKPQEPEIKGTKRGFNAADVEFIGRLKNALDLEIKRVERVMRSRPLELSSLKIINENRLAQKTFLDM